MCTTVALAKVPCPRTLRVSPLKGWEVSRSWSDAQPVVLGAIELFLLRSSSVVKLVFISIVSMFAQMSPPKLSLNPHDAFEHTYI